MASIKTLLQNIQAAKTRQDYSKGEQLCTTALQLDPSNSDLFVLRATFRNAQENFSDAIEDVKVSLKINSTSVGVSI